MQALQLTEYCNLKLVDVPMPTIAPDEVLIRVEACGICGSDVHGYDGSTGRRIPPLSIIATRGAMPSTNAGLPLWFQPWWETT